MILNPVLFDAAIIDLDGTLVDTMADFVVALNLMLADLSLPQVARVVVDPLVGKGSEHLIRSVLDHVQKRPPAHVEKAQAAINSGADADLNSAAWRSYQHHYLAVNGLHVGVSKCDRRPESVAKPRPVARHIGAVGRCWINQA